MNKLITLEFDLFKVAFKLMFKIFKLLPTKLQSRFIWTRLNTRNNVNK